MSDFDVESRSQPVSDYCIGLVTTIGALSAAGEDDSAQKQTRELGRVIGNLCIRAYTFQYMAEKFAAEMPDLQPRVDDLLKASPLPGD